MGELIALLSDQEALQKMIAAAGLLAPLAFLILQAAQVVVAPVPGAVTGMVGGYLFGAFWGSVISQAGITLGSLVAFYLARRFGRPLVERLVPRRTLIRLDDIIAKRGVSGLFMIFILPFLPDDAICFVAGLTNVSYKLFLALVLVARTPSSVVSSLTGAGLVHLSPVGWSIFAALSLAAAALLFRYEDTIRRRLLDKL